jgi:hypothetical protein
MRRDHRLTIRLSTLSLVLAVFTSACGTVHIDGTGHSLSAPELQYRLIAQVGRPLFCGPPVVRVPTPAQAQQEAAALQAADPVTYSAIIQHLKLDATHLTGDDDLKILEQADLLGHVPLTPQGQSDAFDYIAARPNPEHVAGSIDSTGTISLTRHDPTTFPGQGGCPICLAAQDRIATPTGAIVVTQLRAGMMVWTLDAAGGRVAAPVVRVGHTPAPFGHQVVRLVLDDGRVVDASPAHPTADGRQVGDLAVGDSLDGGYVVEVRLLPYAGDTWDLLPAGLSHAYWANGVLLTSTLK